LSISIGVSSPSTLPMPTSEQLLTNADNALNLAKVRGRNCAVASQELPN
jgi:PleD family two-component response regulator